MYYFYKVYGLKVKSQMMINELTTLEDKDNIDVNIVYKPMPQDIKEKISKGRNSTYEKQRMWFNIKGLATYCISNGNEVLIELHENADMQLVKVYILGSVLGMVLLQRNIVAIHGGSIVIDNKGYVFTGDKGAGKSTLTTALRQRGYKFVADDVAAIDIGEINKINPGFGYQKLCEDTMSKLGYDVSKYSPFRSDMNIKYIVPALDSFVYDKVEFAGIFEVEASDDVNSVEIEEIKGTNKVNRIIKNIFRIEIMMYLGGMNPEYFKKCMEISKNVKYYKITRPKDKFTVDEQISFIEDVIFDSDIEATNII